MAKLPQTGVAYQCLYEWESTLAEIVAGLGLKPFRKKAEREIRFRLGVALAKWEEPKTALQIKRVVGSLNAQAKRLDEMASLGTIARMGLAHEQDIETSGRLARCLTSNPAIGSIEAAHAYLEDFCRRAGVIASGCRAAATSLQSTKGQSGKSRYGWYDEFTAMLLVVCKQNNIEPTIGFDSSSDEAVGTLSKIAAAFERLLLPKMRSPASEAMVKRLQRSLRRLEQRVQTPSTRATSREKPRSKRT